MSGQFLGAIFDLDGTLLDSMHVWSGIDVAFLKKRGLAVPKGYAEVLAPLTFRETAEYTIELFRLKETPEAIMAEWNRMAVDAYSREVEMKPHAKDYLSHLKQKGIKLSVCTALSPELYVPALEHHGILRWFDAIVTTDEVNSNKSLPRPFIAAAERMRVPPEKCLVFEDIPAAAQGALDAGMTVCGVFDDSKNETEMQSLCQYFIYDFSEAETII